MAKDAETTESSDFKDRKVRLVVLGVLQIIFGVLCALLVPLMILVILVSAKVGKGPAEGVSIKTMIPGVLVYVVLAVWFIWMGIGSIMARRWARALVLVSSWVWLITGVCAFVFVLVILPDISSKMGESGEIPKDAVLLMKCLMGSFLALFYVGIPGAFVLLYSGKSVKATCEYRDPRQRWTDKCPLPVLAVSFVFAVWAVSMLSMGLYKWAIPFFGSVVSGAMGAVIVLVLALVLAYIAWGTYKLDIKAWWCALLVHIGWSVSAIITFSTVSMEEFYEKMDFSRQQLDMMNRFNVMWESGMKLFIGLWAVAVLAYLIYVRGYFINTFKKSDSLQVSD
jgi:hypothetical protein